jgi:hypothetical protein
VALTIIILMAFVQNVGSSRTTVGNNGIKHDLDMSLAKSYELLIRSRS